MPDDIAALLVLHAAGGAVAPRRALLEALATPAAALQAGPREWRRHGLADAQVQALRQPDTAMLGTSLDWLRASGHRVDLLG